jgi:hypothetical protein
MSALLQTVLPLLPRSAARVALYGMDEASAGILSDCFHQFQIRTVWVSDLLDRLEREKFEGCVLPLDSPEADALLSGARKSRSNSRIVIYALCTDTQQALRYSRYGINVLLDQPVRRASALRAISFSHALLLNELRRYVRLPLATEVSVDAAERHLRGMSHEISAGGMSVCVPEQLPVGTETRVTFALPRAPVFSMQASVCWQRPAESQIGLRFNRVDAGREHIKTWINNYLGIA